MIDRCPHDLGRNPHLDTVDNIHQVWAFSLSCDGVERTRQIKILEAAALAIRNAPIPWRERAPYDPTNETCYDNI